MQQRFPLGPVPLQGLRQEQLIDIGVAPIRKSPLEEMNASTRVAALPEVADAVRKSPRSFFSRQADRNGARSMVRIRTRIPTACHALELAGERRGHIGAVPLDLQLCLEANLRVGCPRAWVVPFRLPRARVADLEAAWKTLRQR
jgi:hypothetical protein